MAFKGTKIILVGAGGSGKDFLRKKFQKRGFKYCVPYTSRPKRAGEKEGVDYYFKDDSFFVNNVHKFYDIPKISSYHNIKTFFTDPFSTFIAGQTSRTVVVF
jgi:hypothetical protein